MYCKTPASLTVLSPSMTSLRMEIDDENMDLDTTICETAQRSEVIGTESNDAGNESTAVSASTGISVAEKVNNFERHVTFCMLKLREKHILPATVQQDII